jgi:hypothetical protein
MGTVKHDRAPRRALGALIVVAALALLALPSSAFAGRLWATGHDADLHCNGSSGSQCHYLSTAVNYVRGGAPNPGAKVLVLDNSSMQLENSMTAQGIPHDTFDPRGSAWPTVSLDPAVYSAILVASDTTCGGCDLNNPPFPGSSQTPDTDAINARKADIAAFFNAGGGILALAGAEHGGDDPSQPPVYYDFVPLPLGATAVTNPFCLTDIGISLGLEDVGGCPDASKHTGTHNDINCCATHNSFELPASGSAIQVAETDANGKAETLVAEGTIEGGAIKRPTTTAVACSPNPVPGGSPTNCTATVADVGAGTKSAPTGPVAFTSDGAGSFGNGGSCALTASGPDTSTCALTYTPGATSGGSHNVTAAYAGDASHGSSKATTLLGKIAASQCVDVRRFTFKLHHGPRSRVVKVKVFVDKKLRKTFRGKNIKKITITKLPQRYSTVKIVSYHSNGSRLVSKRVYLQCTKNKPKVRAHHARHRGGKGRKR